MLKHITLEQLQGLNSGEKFWASFSPTSPAYEYEMVEDVRSYVTYRSHLVTGSWQGELGCPSRGHAKEEVWEKVTDRVCPGCHHLVVNHPECKQFSWLVVLCEGVHKKL